MDKYLKYALIVFMILSLLLNLFMFFVIGVQEVEWKQAYYINSVEWCEVVNDYGDMINDLAVELRYYDDTYSDLDLFEKTDCFDMIGDLE